MLKFCRSAFVCYYVGNKIWGFKTQTISSNLSEFFRILGFHFKFNYNANYVLWSREFRN